MARPNKTGIDYFSLDVDFFQDEKVQFVSARFGLKGELIIIRLLCKIYRSGYYTEWNDDTALLFAKSVGDGCLDSCVKDVVHELLKRGFFERSIFERFGILTSRGIQNRYFEAVKRYRQVEIIKDFLLVDVSKMDNVVINSINVYINSENAYTNAQIKGKESKLKEIKSPKPPLPDLHPAAKKDFIDEIIFSFLKINPEYEIVNNGKERAAAGKLLKIYKNKSPAADSKETLAALENYFARCKTVPDAWLQNNMSLSIIISKFNEINKLLKNGNNQRTNSGGATAEQLASLYARKFVGNQPV